MVLSCMYNTNVMISIQGSLRRLCNGKWHVDCNQKCNYKFSHQSVTFSKVRTVMVVQTMTLRRAPPTPSNAASFSLRLLLFLDCNLNGHIITHNSSAHNLGAISDSSVCNTYQGHRQHSFLISHLGSVQSLWYLWKQYPNTHIYVIPNCFSFTASCLNQLAKSGD